MKSTGITVLDGSTPSIPHAPGVVCQWLFDTCAGIRVDGENRFTIQPVPGPGLEHAGARYLSPCGKVSSAWKKENGKIIFTIGIPANCEADIVLPNGRRETVTAGRYTYDV